MKAIGLDLGSSYTKCALLDAEGFCVRVLERESPPGNVASGAARYEIDAEAYYRHARDMLTRALDMHPDAEAVLFSTQMHGFVLSDAQNRPLTPYVSWRDAACLESGALDELRARIPAELMRDSGVPLKPNLAMCNLYARLREGLCVPDGARLHTLGGYVIARLCGAHTCHVTNAAPTGLLNARTREWNGPLARIVLPPEVRLPNLSDTLSPVGLWEYRNRTIALYPDFGDHQVCAYGGGLALGDELHVNIGTAGLIGRLSEAFQRGSFEARPYFDGLYLLSRSGLPGGRHLSVIAEFIADALRTFGAGGEDEAWAYMTRETRAGGLTVDLNFFAGCGSVGGIGESFTLSGLVGSVYQSIARAYTEAARALGASSPALRFSGGAAEKNPALRQCIEEALGSRAVKRETNADDVMRGLLSLYARATTARR